MIQLWVLKNWCKNTFLLQKKKAFLGIIFFLDFSAEF
jgi:hypothetical protein